MRGFVPKRPTGSTPEARFAQWVYDELMANRLQDSPDARTMRTTRGFVAIAKGKKGGGGGSITYKRDYDPNKAYRVGDIVRKRTGAGSVTGFTGLAICVQDAPAGNAPEFPESQYWDVWQLGIQTYVACRNGVGKTTYIQLMEV